MRQPRIVDLRNIFDPDEMRRQGFAYVGVGRGSRSAATGRAEASTDHSASKRPATGHGERALLP
jgi:UDPglucose 6-dehydrogenase